MPLYFQNTAENQNKEEVVKKKEEVYFQDTAEGRSYKKAIKFDYV